MKLSAAFTARYDVDQTSLREGRAHTFLKGKDRESGNPVAIKLLEEGPHLKSWFGEDLLARATRARELKHPNVVPVRDCGRDSEGYIYVISDYMDGVPFRDRVAEHGSMGLYDALSATAGILAALVYLHEHGFVHGHLKLENVILTKAGKPLVTDFALLPLRMGTRPIPSNPDNVAPELVQDPNSPPTCAGDIYAVGTILYQLVTGSPPFHGDSPLETFQMHLEATPPSVLSAHPDIPLEVDEIVQRAMRKEPARRFASAFEMLEAVTQAMQRARPTSRIPGGKWNYLLVAAPIAIAAEHLHWPAPVTFFASGISIVPLAAVLAESTEHLAEHTGPAVGGFLNATFGNATEILISLLGIWKGGVLVDTVKASLTGSILGNLLLIMGMAMLIGGLRRERQQFNTTAAGVGNSLMILAVTGLMIPSILHGIYHDHPALVKGSSVQLQRLSLWVSFILLVTYVLSLIFSLRTHRHLYSEIPEVTEEEAPNEHLMSPGKAFLLLAGSTAAISFLSEILVSSVEAAGAALHINPVFMGLIVIATVGNAAEHATAVMVGMKNKMDLAIAIAMGSSIQVALFLAPMLVVVSWLMGRPMDLVFSPMEVVAVAAAVGITLSVNVDGESTWFEGCLLLAVYAILAVAFWFLPMG